MGQSQHQVHRLNNEWTYIDTLANTQIYKNQQNQLAEKHIVPVDPKIQQDDYIIAYAQRYLPKKPIVNAFDVQFMQRGVSMCQNSSVITVYTEFIPYRLSDVKMLNHGQGIYVLSEALAGFSELYGRVGPFQIHEDLIGFNQQGEVRVWYNPNFADNAIDNDRVILMSTVNPYDFDRKFSQNQEHDMIEDTINAIARYTKFNPIFLQQAQQLKKVSFYQARKILANQIGRKAYYVPDHLLLGDRNGIIKKSGIQLKHRHVSNPNKPKIGEKYPYFYEGANTLANQQPQYEYSQNDSSSDYQYNGQGGYYNLNGENYRIIATREIEGDEVNERAIIDEVMRSNAYSQPKQYPSNPQYIQDMSRGDQYYPQPNKYPQPNNYQIVNTQVSRNPPNNYQEGHIIVRDTPQLLERQRSQVVYRETNQYGQQSQQPRIQQSVKVFSVGENGRLIQESRFNQPQYQSTVVNTPINIQSHYRPTAQFGEASRSYNNSGNFVPRNPQPAQLNSPKSVTHRHKIFDQTSPRRMMREVQPLPQQKAF